MKCLFLLLALLPAAASAQDPDVRFAGSHPPEHAVLELMQRYAAATMDWDSVGDRDSLRAPLVAPGYFYHGQDGHPIGFDGLTARQTRNELRIDDFRIYDVVLHQYAHTAIATYKIYNRGEDRGAPFERYDSGAVVMTQTDDGWRVVADLIGQEPAPPATD